MNYLIVFLFAIFYYWQKLIINVNNFIVSFGISNWFFSKNKESLQVKNLKKKKNVLI